MKFYLKVFGCQYNEWDATRLAYLLKELGLIGVSTKEKADIIFITNCSVRKTAVDRAMSWVKNIQELDKKVVVLGCVLESDRQKLMRKKVLLWDGADMQFLYNICGLKTNYIQTKQDLKDAQKFTNLIPIMKGCNNFCTYCAVPYTRGREISRDIEDIISDVETSVAAGHKEIILLGQNVNSYQGVISNPFDLAQGRLREKSHEISRLDKSMARNDKTKIGFADLLRAINELDGDFIVRFTSNHPKDMTDDIIKAISDCDKVVKEIHLPLQSGSNKILKAMNRPYTKEQYLNLVQKIKNRIPSVELTTDTIVGFPGETEEDFQETAELLKQINFYQSYNNKYSPRSGTAAFKLGDPIPWSEKQRRWRILNEIVYKRR